MLTIHFVASPTLGWLRVRVFRSRMPSSELEDSPRSEPDLSSTNMYAEMRGHVVQHGGAIIFAFNLVRLVGCLALLCLSIFSPVSDARRITPRGAGLGEWGYDNRGRKLHRQFLSVEEWLKLSMCLTHVRLAHFSGLTI